MFLQIGRFVLGLVPKDAPTPESAPQPELERGLSRIIGFRANKEEASDGSTRTDPEAE